ncbi:MAG: phosphoserine phosphatase SerB [Burkholderiaceae bacterium]|jgi:phosphoserine phosphatase|nr:phosphoserine phosphatase SerB [Burkholderiaceae bacterium]
MKDLVLQGPRLSPEALDTFKVVCAPRKITVTGRVARCVEVPDDAETRKAVRGLAEYWTLDAAFVDPAMKLADFRLLAMDMDSTLINIESLDEVAALAGQGEQVAAITEAAMRGEIKDYAGSLRQRVALLAGVDAALLQRVLDEKLRLNAGAAELVAACKRAGLATLLVTGGFTFFTDVMRQRLGFDHVRANVLGLEGGRLTGTVTGPDGGAILDAQGKAEAVRAVCAQLGCATDRAIAIGDGANDLKMMALAGLSVAYRAKPVVRTQATQSLNHAPLDGVLAWFAA